MSKGGHFSGILVALLTSLVVAGSAQALPITSAPPAPTLPDFSGAAVKAFRFNVGEQVSDGAELVEFEADKK